MADLLKREIAKKKDALSKTLAADLATGDMLSDDAATELIRASLFRTNLNKGFILDGYPATAGQAKSLDRMLQDQQLPQAVVVVLEAPDDVIRQTNAWARTGRRQAEHHRPAHSGIPKRSRAVSRMGGPDTRWYG
jgi:adenylate kinase